jgi:hypothetical protein
MLNDRPILREENVHIIHDRLEKRRGNAGAIEVESGDIMHVSIGVESHEWSHIHVFYVSKADIYVVLYGEYLNSFQGQKKTNGPDKI